MAKQLGTRSTAQKEAVRQALTDAPGFITVQNLHRGLRNQRVRVGLATVYRQLKGLATDGLADVVMKGSEQLFRTCEQPDKHHHHLICELCGDAVEIDPGDEDWFARVAREHGFALTRHTIEIYGRCSRCTKA
ncbi:Fur family transcriptional regulator [Auritidibacter ignavus]|uniref:Fur family transcriptional regulator n=1 Tax=Auritidibacter ignavus TaxID=678932 RepID=A0AAJ6AFU8_9MICC|nr:Fur family transcriptional regulator [Auritidibacter ignavus]WGH92525.1 Fur family transcriptional regulator [Auritidibacter ignavus]WHS29096.1 Fur family transcriptional regulator [Auritidibacter ignavus]